DHVGRARLVGGRALLPGWLRARAVRGVAGAASAGRAAVLFGLPSGASLAPGGEFRFERAVRLVNRLDEAQAVAQPAAQAVERGVVQAERGRVAERVVGHEPVAFEDEVGNL